MLKVSALISFSFFSWFLSAFYLKFTVFSSLTDGLVQLILLSFLPISLSYYINRRILSKGPVILSIILLNAAEVLIYTSITVWGCYFFGRIGLLTVQYPGGRAEGVFYSVWQLLAWSCGVFFAVKTAGTEADIPPTGIIAISSIAVPGILALAGMNCPVSLLLFAIGGWYFSLVFTLATRGKETPRYGISLIHCIIPGLAGIFIFFIVFSKEFQLLSLQVKNVLKAVISFLLHLLEALSPRISQYDSTQGELWKTWEIPLQSVEMPGIGESGDPRILIFMVVIGLGLCIILLWQFFRFTLTRLAPAKAPLPEARLSLVAVLLETGRQIVLLGLGLLQIIFKLFTMAYRGIILLKKSAVLFIESLLPPKTPDQAVLRIYLKLLRWGCSRGVRRAVSETPLEYAARLESLFGKSSFHGQEIRQLTMNFLQIRYRNTNADWKLVQECKHCLKTIKDTA